MSNLVQQINESVESIVSSVVDPEYGLLDYKYDVFKNSFRSGKKRYAVIPQGAGQENTITKVYTAAHTFEVILTDEYVNRDDDTAQRSAVFGLFDNHDEILKEVFNKKAGLPNIVYNIRSFAYSDPEFIDDSSVAVVRMQLEILYRNAIN